MHLTDFGIGKMNNDNSNDGCGTPGYMSPEVSSGLPQSFQADFFSMGIIGYEFMFGKRPYHTSNRRAYVQDLTSKQIFISKEDYPELCEWSDESIDFINRLLIRKQDKRLGAGGIDELKNHKWFWKFDWDALYNQELLSPFIFCIDVDDSYDKKYCNSCEIVGMDTLERYQRYMTKEGFVSYFLGYTYNNEKDKKGLNERNEKTSSTQSTSLPTQNKLAKSCNFEQHNFKLIPNPHKHSLFSRSISKEKSPKINLNNSISEKLSTSIKVQKISIKKPSEPLKDNKNMINLPDINNSLSARYLYNKHILEKKKPPKKAHLTRANGIGKVRLRVKAEDTKAYEELINSYKFPKIESSSVSKSSIFDKSQLFYRKENKL